MEERRGFKVPSSVLLMKKAQRPKNGEGKKIIIIVVVVVAVAVICRPVSIEHPGRKDGGGERLIRCENGALLPVVALLGDHN